MSILIKGAEIPDCCTYCDYIGLNKAVECGHFTNIAGRAPDCPLVEIPPHGRLIDADEVMKSIKEDYCDSCQFKPTMCHDCHISDVLFIIANAPTVIEIEEK